MKKVEIKGKYRKVKGSYITTAILCILFGLILCIWPDKVANAANYVLGSIILVVGIVYLALSFWAKERNFMTGFGMVFSVVLIAIGVFMFLQPQFVLSLFPVIVGGIIVIHGLVDLKCSIDFSTLKYGNWWVALIISFATIGLGVLLIFNPFKAVTLAFRIIGIVLILDGISEFWIGFKLKKLIPNEEYLYSEKEIIEVSGREK